MPSYVHHTELPYGAGEICTCQRDHWRRQIHARCGQCSKWIYPGPESYHVAPRALEWLAESGQVAMCGTESIGLLPRYGMRLPSRDTSPTKCAKYRRSRWDRRLRVGIELEVLAASDSENTGVLQMRTLDAFMQLNALRPGLDRVPMYAVVKNEASVRHGFEICTVPCTMTEHMLQLSCLRHMPYLRVNSDCGLHIHMDRRDLTPLLYGKLFCFWNKVAQADLDVVRVMGRTHNHWALLPNRIPPAGLPYQTPGPRRHGRNSRYGRHWHSVSGKMRVMRVDRPDTIELRLPMASQDPDVVLGRISAFVTSTLFLRDVSIADVAAGRITLSSMYAWCMDDVERQQDPDIRPFVDHCRNSVPSSWR